MEIGSPAHRAKLACALADLAEQARRRRATNERAAAAEAANGLSSVWDAFHGRGFIAAIPVYDGIETDVPCGKAVA